jgi:hypothetical protein
MRTVFPGNRTSLALIFCGNLPQDGFTRLHIPILRSQKAPSSILSSTALLTSENYLHRNVDNDKYGKCSKLTSAFGWLNGATRGWKTIEE